MTTGKKQDEQESKVTGGIKPAGDTGGVFIWKIDDDAHGTPPDKKKDEPEEDD